MTIQYQGKKDGIPTKFAIKIYGGNLSKTSSNYELEFLEGDKQLPIFTTSIHQSLSNCLIEIYLFRKHNHITFDVASEKVVSEYVPYDKVLYDFNKKFIFMA